MNEIEEKVLAKCSFNEAELAQIKSVSEKIDVADAKVISGFASSVQARISEMVDVALRTIQDMDTRGTGKLASKVVAELRETIEGPEGLLQGLSQNDLTNFARTNERLALLEQDTKFMLKTFEETGKQLQQEIDSLERLYERNKHLCKELLMQEESGKLALEKANEDASVEKTSTDDFKSRLIALNSSKLACVESAPEIRITQNNDSILYDKILDVTHTNLPNWKGMLKKALDDFIAEHSSKKTSEEEVDEAAALEKQDRLNMNLEYLTTINTELVNILEEIEKIVEYGRQGRVSSITELRRIKNELVNSN